MARDDRVVKAEFDVWLARDMFFNNPPGLNIRKYSIYTIAKKVKYTRAILRYLDRMEGKSRSRGGDHAVAIKLGGKIRYVWRKDLLSKKEYDAIKKKQGAKLGVLRKKLRGDVGKDGS